jgi:predicted O-methyltransferase YrrM
MTDAQQIVQRLREISPRIESIQGWMDINAGGAMYHCVRDYIPIPLVVELGSWKGKSTAWIAQALVDRGGGKVVAVDTWAGTAAEGGHFKLLEGYGPDQLYEEFLANMVRLGLRDTVEPWRMSTVEAAGKWPHGQRIGLLYIDASHEYRDVRADFELWSPHVETGGFIVFDDVPTWKGPTQLVTELPRWYRFFGAPTNQYYVQKV